MSAEDCSKTFRHVSFLAENFLFLIFSMKTSNCMFGSVGGWGGFEVDADKVAGGYEVTHRHYFPGPARLADDVTDVHAAELMPA